MIKITKTDSEKEINGVWTTYDGVKVKIARVNNTIFLRKLRAKAEKTPEGSISKMSTNKSDELMIELMAETVLVNWEPFEYNGETIDYSVENAISLLTHDFDFRDFVTDFSRDLSNYLRDDISGK